MDLVKKLSNQYQCGLLSDKEYIRRRINLYRVDKLIDAIYLMMDQPGHEPMTSNDMRTRADGRRAIATQAKLSGIAVRDEYDYHS